MQMFQRLIAPPRYSDAYLDAHARFLHIALWFTFFMAIYFAVINVDLTRVSFGVLAAASLIGLILNSVHQYFLSASIPVVLGTVALFFNFYDGISLYDPGIVALPLLIILTSFLFGSRLIYRVALVSVVGVVLLGYLERAGVISPPDRASNERILVIYILVLFAAVLQKRIIQSCEWAKQ